ncbi:MAG: hypothetical protein WCP21_16180, partial [Armatimonadota bacterium]
MLRTFAAVLVCAFLLTSCLAQETGGAGPLRLAAPLLAYWDFDELAGATCADVSDQGNDATPERPGMGGARRGTGVFGQALWLSGNHSLCAPGRPDFSETKTLSLSAWVQPTEFGPYNEIFRKEDGEMRVLFSFQEHGTILSLGLNIGGYVECDAPIQPEK